MNLADMVLEEVTGLLRLLIGTSWIPVSISVTDRVIYITKNVFIIIIIT